MKHFPNTRKGEADILPESQGRIYNHCVKYRNFTQFPGVENLWKGTVSV